MLSLFTASKQESIRISCIDNTIKQISFERCALDKSVFTSTISDKQEKTLNACKTAFTKYIVNSQKLTVNGNTLNERDEYTMPGFFTLIDQYNEEMIICFFDKVVEMHTEMLFLYYALPFIKNLPDSYPVKSNPYFLIYTYASPCERCLETYYMLSKEHPTYIFEIFYTQRYKKNCISSLFYSKYKESEINFSNSFSFPLLDKAYFSKQCSTQINTLSDTLYYFYKNQQKNINGQKQNIKEKYFTLGQCSETIYKDIITNKGDIKEEYFSRFHFEIIELIQKTTEKSQPAYIYNYKYLRKKLDKLQFIKEKESK